MNIMTLDGFNAKIEYDPEIDMFRGEILGLTGGADFYGKNPKELRAEFRSLSRSSSKSAERRASSLGAATPESSTCASRRTFTKSSPSLLRPKARASTPWRKRHFNSA